MNITTYPKMNAEIVKLLRASGTNYELYAAARIEELEACAQRWKAVAERLCLSTLDTTDHGGAVEECERMLKEEAKEAELP